MNDDGYDFEGGLPFFADEEEVDDATEYFEEPLIGNEVDDDGDDNDGDDDGDGDGAMGSGATGYDDDDDGDGRRQRR